MIRQYSTDSDNSQGLSPKRACREEKSVEAVEEEAAANTMDPDAVREIQLALRDIKSNQESLKNSIETRLDAMTGTIKALKDDLYLELSNLEKKVQKVEERLETLETRQDVEYPVDTSVVVINLREDASENIEAKCGNLVQNALGLRDTKPVRCMRLTSRDGKPGVVKIQFRTKQDKITVLRHKGELSKMPGYKKVFVRSAQTHEERIMRLNIQTLLRDMPDGNSYRFTGSGRLVKKDDTEDPHQLQSSQQQQIPGSSQQGRQQHREQQQRHSPGNSATP